VPQSAVPGSLDENISWSTAPVPNRPSTRVVDYTAIVLRAVQRCERPVGGGYFRCDNLSIDQETGLDPAIVDATLGYLWTNDLIEGIPGWSDRRPSLTGIRRVLADRPRLWNEMGRFNPGIRTIKDR
jgi:hypothetical protein